MELLVTEYIQYTACKKTFGNSGPLLLKTQTHCNHFKVNQLDLNGKYTKYNDSIRSINIKKQPKQSHINNRALLCPSMQFITNPLTESIYFVLGCGCEVDQLSSLFEVFTV